jgi:hypothetical protein
MVNGKQICPGFKFLLKQPSDLTGTTAPLGVGMVPLAGTLSQAMGIKIIKSPEGATLNV